MAEGSREEEGSAELKHFLIGRVKKLTGKEGNERLGHTGSLGSQVCSQASFQFDACGVERSKVRTEATRMQGREHGLLRVWLPPSN